MIIELREESIVKGKGLSCQVLGLRKTESGSISFLRPDTRDLRPLSFAGLRLEAVVDFHLVSHDEAIGFVSHADHGHQLFELGVGHAFVFR